MACCIKAPGPCAADPSVFVPLGYYAYCDISYDDGTVERVWGEKCTSCDTVVCEDGGFGGGEAGCDDSGSVPCEEPIGGCAEFLGNPSRWAEYDYDSCACRWKCEFLDSCNTYDQNGHPVVGKILDENDCTCDALCTVGAHCTGTNRCGQQVAGVYNSSCECELIYDDCPPEESDSDPCPECTLLGLPCGCFEESGSDSASDSSSACGDKCNALGRNTDPLTCECTDCNEYKVKYCSTFEHRKADVDPVTGACVCTDCEDHIEQLCKDLGRCFDANTCTCTVCDNESELKSDCAGKNRDFDPCKCECGDCTTDTYQMCHSAGLIAGIDAEGRCQCCDEDAQDSKCAAKHMKPVGCRCEGCADGFEEACAAQGLTMIGPLLDGSGCKCGSCLEDRHQLCYETGHRDAVVENDVCVCKGCEKFRDGWCKPLGWANAMEVDTNCTCTGCSDAQITACGLIGGTIHIKESALGSPNSICECKFPTTSSGCDDLYCASLFGGHGHGELRGGTCVCVADDTPESDSPPESPPEPPQDSNPPSGGDSGGGDSSSSGGGDSNPSGGGGGSKPESQDSNSQPESQDSNSQSEDSDSDPCHDIFTKTWRNGDSAAATLAACCRDSGGVVRWRVVEWGTAENGWYDVLEYWCGHDGDSKPEESESQPEDSNSKPEESSKPESHDSRPESQESRPESHDSKPEESQSQPESQADSQSQPEESASDPCRGCGATAAKCCTDSGRKYIDYGDGTCACLANPDDCCTGKTPATVCPNLWRLYQQNPGGWYVYLDCVDAVNCECMVVNGDPESGDNIGGDSDLQQESTRPSESQPESQTPPQESQTPPQRARPLHRRTLGRRTLGRRTLSRRTLSRRTLGRRTLGRRTLSRRTLSRRTLSRRTLSRRTLSRRRVAPVVVAR